MMQHILQVGVVHGDNFTIRASIAWSMIRSNVKEEDMPGLVRFLGHARHSPPPLHGFLSEVENASPLVDSRDTGRTGGRGG